MDAHRIQNFVVKRKEIFVGLEDSKTTWKIAVRCEKMLIHQVSMEAKYLLLRGYLLNKFPECMIHLLYEAGFKGFNLYDRLTEDHIDCVIIPPHTVTHGESQQSQDGQKGCKEVGSHSGEPRLQGWLPRP